MHTRTMVGRIGVCGSVLLVLFLMGVAGAGQAATSAQEAVTTPVSPTPAATTGDMSPWQPVPGGDVNGVGDGGRQSFRQDPGGYAPDSTGAGGRDILPGAEASLPYVPRGPITGTCPMDSGFNGAAPGWAAYTGDWNVNSEYLYTEGVAGGAASAGYVAGEFGNFDYEARMWRSGCDTCANRVICRGAPDPLSANNDWYSAYYFQYTSAGAYSIYKAVADGAYTAIANWTSSPAINQGEAWNTLRVTADGANLAFYINGTLLWSGTDASLSGGRAGVGMYRYPSSTGDELRVDWARLCVPYTTCLPLAMLR